MEKSLMKIAQDLDLDLEDYSSTAMTRRGLSILQESKNPLTALAESRPDLAYSLMEQALETNRSIKFHRDNTDLAIAKVQVKRDMAEFQTMAAARWISRRDPDEETFDMEQAVGRGGFFGGERVLLRTSVRIGRRR